MTRMLASVADAAEAEVALRLGADIIDLKDVRKGSLGAVNLEIAKAAVGAVARRCETSATLGDPPYDRSSLLARGLALAEMGVDYLKLAIDRETIAMLRDPLKNLAREASLVGMMFADEAPDFALLPDLAGLGFKGAMLDTRNKRGGRLLTLIDVARLEAFCSKCRTASLISGLAGSLEAPDVPRLLLVKPDVLGFRGALCRDRSRGGPIDPQAVTLIRDLIPRESPDAEASPKIDWRLIARGIIGGREHESEIDRVFVRDFVVSALIGAYDSERDVPQRVLFNVDALVRRQAAHVDDIRAIFSYDVILDAVRLVVGRGHVEFVETLAEDVAAIVLQHARVRSVRVNVRKLDVIDGAVGVEIFRERASGFAEVRPLGAAPKTAAPPSN